MRSRRAGKGTLGGPARPSLFQLRVYEAVRRIPFGQVASYSVVAGAIGCGSARVIGQALRCCQDETVPCHRVVAAEFTIGGFGGKSSGPAVARKRRLLEAEGVRFGRTGRIEPACTLRDSPGTFHLLTGGSGNGEK